MYKNMACRQSRFDSLHLIWQVFHNVLLILSFQDFF